jgi:RNA polymerase sigma-70 factor (ECF subfamily)
VRPELEQVVRLVKRKDRPSLEEALALLHNTVFSFSMKVCGQRQDAEDTAQEVLLQSLAKLSKFDNARALLVWLYKVAKTRCLMSRRKSKFSPKGALSLEALMPDKKELAGLSQRAPENPETAMVRRESTRCLRDAVQKLPPEYRLVLVLRDMEELSDGDVAEITGLKPGTVRVRLHRARLFVRKEVEKSATVKKFSRPPAAIHAPKRERRCKQMFAQLSDYLDDRLDDSLCDELEKHMDGCQPCQAFLASLQHSIEQCRRTPAEGMDPKHAAELRRTVLAQYQAALSGRPAPHPPNQL